MKSHENILPTKKLVLFVSILLYTNISWAQQSTAWFGLEVPNGLGDPHRAVIDVSEVKPPVAAVAEGEQQDTELVGTRIWTDVERIVDFSKQSRANGDQIWGRVTGFPAAKETVRWVADQFNAANLSSVEVQEYIGSGAMWWPDSWQVRIQGNQMFGAGSEDVILGTSLPTGESFIEGGSIVAGLIPVGSINDELSATELSEVAGNVAVQHVLPERSAYTSRTPTRERAQKLMAAGAVAVINVVEQVGNMHVRDFSRCNGPCFNIGTKDGEFLEGIIANAELAGSLSDLKIELRLQAENLTGLKGHNAMGIVAGNSPEIVIVNAHADGWFDAAGDNADGLAVLLALARHFSLPENKPQRTLLFVASGGHHSSGLNGPGNFVSMNSDLIANAVLAINLEHIAQFYIHPHSWEIDDTEQPMSYSITNEAAYLTDLTRQAMDRSGFNLNPEFRTRAPGDLGGYRSLNIPMIQAIHSGPMYHTSGDVLETISVPGLERAARFYAYFIEQVSGAALTDLDPE